jgi:hypothetical protein
LLDSVLSASQKSGYKFTTTGTTGTNTAPNNTYTVVALPVAPGSSGQSSFFSDESGVIRKDPAGGTPTTATPPIQ